MSTDAASCHLPLRTGSRTVLGRPWPFCRHDLLVLVGWYLVIVAVYVAIGELITRTGPIVEADHRAARAFAGGRTATGNAVAPWAAGLSDTIVKVALTAAVVVAMLAVWKRWLEPAIVAGALILEASAFITITYIVARPRPPVEQLQESPVDSSFPSGHVAAAAAYLAVSLVLSRRIGSSAVRMIVWVVPVVVTGLVAWARLYQGMHFVSDVVFGVLLGLWSVAVVATVLTRADERTRSRVAPPVDERVSDVAAATTDPMPA